MSFWRTYYHIVWATKNREALITPEIEPRLYAYIVNKAAELGVYVYALNGWIDHVHIVAASPPKEAIAHVVKTLKGSSSHDLNQQGVLDTLFAWQRGYGVLSLGSRQLADAVAYVRRQKELTVTIRRFPGWSTMRTRTRDRRIQMLWVNAPYRACEKKRSCTMSWANRRSDVSDMAGSRIGLRIGLRMNLQPATPKPAEAGSAPPAQPASAGFPYQFGGLFDATGLTGLRSRLRSRLRMNSQPVTPKPAEAGSAPPRPTRFSGFPVPDVEFIRRLMRPSRAHQRPRRLPRPHQHRPRADHRGRPHRGPGPSCRPGHGHRGD